jgi:hypothetical protein
MTCRFSSKPQRMQQQASKTRSHFFLSLAKSFLRAAGCVWLYLGDYQVAAGLFIVAESFGILEEL